MPTSNKFIIIFIKIIIADLNLIQIFQSYSIQQKQFSFRNPKESESDPFQSERFILEQINIWTISCDAENYCT